MIKVKVTDKEKNFNDSIEGKMVIAVTIDDDAKVSTIIGGNASIIELIAMVAQLRNDLCEMLEEE